MIKLPGSPSSDKSPIAAAIEAISPQPGSEELPSPDVAQFKDGTFTGDATQVAGLGSTLKGIVRTTKAMKATRSVAEVKAGVMERAVPRVSEQAATNTLSRADVLPPAPIDPGRTSVRNFRSDKLNTTDDVKRLIDDFATQNEGFTKARRGVVSHEQTKSESAAYGIDDLLGRKPSEAWNAAQLQAGRDILLELGSRAMTMAEKVKSGSASAEDMLSLRQTLAQHEAVQQTLQGATAEAGRALNIMRATAVPAGRLRSRQVLEALDNLGGEADTRRLAEMILDTGGDPLKFANVTRKGIAARYGDALTEVWINGLLSGPQTHIVNATSNTLAALLQIPERAVAGAGRSVAKAFGAGDGVELGESGAQLYGFLSGFKDGVRAFARAVKTGESMDASTKVEQYSHKAFTADNLGVNPDTLLGRSLDLLGEHYVRLPGRFLTAEDDLFKVIGYRMELNAQAYRQAVQEGLSGPARDARIAELIANPTEDIHMAAEQAAKYQTFTENLTGDNWLETVGQAGQKLSSLPAGKFVLPFIRTPTNIAAFTLERTPLAPTMASWRADVAAGGASRDLALARAGMGSLFSALVADLAYHDRITGDGPADKKVRADMMAAGWQPNSIYIDGNYYGINRLDPVGSLISNAANAVDILKYADESKDTEHVPSAMVMGFAKAMTNKTYMKGLSDVLDIIGDPNNEKKLSTWMSRQEASMVPAWLNFGKQLTDDIVRDPSRADHLTQTIDMMKARIPGLSDQVPPKLDLFGEPIRMESSPLSPVRVTTVQDNPEAVEIAKNRIGVSAPNSVVHVKIGEGQSSPVDLYAVDPTGNLLADYKLRSGVLAKRAVGDLIRNPDFQKLPEGPDGERANYIRDAFQNARRTALDEIISEQAQRKAKDPNFTSLEDHALAAYEAGKRSAMAIPQPLTDALQPAIAP